MPNLSNCSKCNSKMEQGGIDESTGEFVCSNCIAHNETQYNCFSIINKLISFHLDELILVSQGEKSIMESIRLLDAFLSHHIEELKKVNSMKMVRSILNK